MGFINLILSVELSILALLICHGNTIALTPVFGLWTFFLLKHFNNSLRTPSCTIKQNLLQSLINIICTNTSKILLIIIFSLAVFSYGWTLINRPVKVIDDASIARQILYAEQFYLSGEPEKAIEIFHSINIPPYYVLRRAQQYHNIGVISMRLNRWDDAEVAFNNAVKYDPNDVDAYFNLARLAFRKNNIKSAINNLDVTLRLNCDHIGARCLLAKCYILNNDYVKARFELQLADRLTSDGHPLKREIIELLNKYK